jgi:hypothetical protein
MQVHPSQISPGESFDLFYFIRNHTDAATYFVRAVVYDVKTGEVLDTQNLTQSSTNARLFIKTVQAPPDPTGYGRNIVAIATVYTDSGYTAKSQDYEEQEQYYLIKSIPLFSSGGGGIDYRAIGDIFDEKIAKALKALPTPTEPQNVPYEAIFGAIGALQREVNRIPKDEFDSEEITTALTGIKDALDTLPKDKTDLSGTEDALFQIAEQLSILERSLKTFGASLLAEQKAAMQTMATDVLTQVETGVREMLANQELTIPLDKLFKQPDTKAQEAPHADIMHLLG